MSKWLSKVGDFLDQVDGAVENVHETLDATVLPPPPLSDLPSSPPQATPTQTNAAGVMPPDSSVAAVAADTAPAVNGGITSTPPQPANPAPPTPVPSAVAPQRAPSRAPAAPTADLQKQVRALTRDLSGCDAEIVDLKREIAEQSTHVASAKLRRADLQHDYDLLVAKFKALEVQHDETRATLETMTEERTDEVSGARGREEEIKRITDSRDEAVAKFESTSSQYTALKRQSEEKEMQFQTEISSRDKAAAKLKSQITSAASTLAAEKAKAAGQGVRDAMVAQLSSEVEVKTQQTNTLRHELKNTISERAQAETQTTEAKQELERTKRLIDDLSAKLVAVTNKYDELERNQPANPAAGPNYESMVKSLNEQALVAQLRIDETKNEKSALSARLRVSMNARADLERRLAEAEAAVLNVTDDNSKDGSMRRRGAGSVPSMVSRWSELTERAAKATSATSMPLRVCPCEYAPCSSPWLHMCVGAGP